MNTNSPFNSAVAFGSPKSRTETKKDSYPPSLDIIEDDTTYQKIEDLSSF